MKCIEIFIDKSYYLKQKLENNIISVEELSLDEKFKLIKFYQVQIAKKKKKLNYELRKLKKEGVI